MGVDTTTVLHAVNVTRQIFDDDLIKLVGQTLGGALAVGLPVLYLWLKERSKSFNWTKEKMDIHSIVQDRLIEMRVKFNVDRASIMEFSNSDKTVNGFPFLFETMTFEKTEEHVQPIKEKFNKIPASWFIGLNQPFIQRNVKYGKFSDDGSVWLDGKKIGINEEVGATLRSLGIKEMFRGKLTTDIADGIVGLTSHHESINLTHDEILDFLADVQYIWYNMAQRPK